MPEIRVNPLTGERVIVAPARASRPSQLSRRPVPPESEPSSCPFCPGNERETPLEVMAVAPEGRAPDGPGWLLRVVPNLFPALEGGDPDAVTESVEGDGLLRSGPARGRHEVIIHGPDHHAGLADLDDDAVARVLEAYRHRILAHRKELGIEYVQVILNHGGGSGASLAHSHSQVFALPFVPSRMERELAGAREWNEERGSCLFCDLLAREADGERSVMDEGGLAAFCAFAPRFPCETWVVPRTHSPRFEDCGDDELWELGRALKALLAAFKRGLDDPPYNLVLHTAPCRAEAPRYHWHFELMPRLSWWGGFELATEVIICSVSPEQAAALLRSHLD